MRILNVVGARPNLMKIAPIVEAMNRAEAIKPRLLHTGQHYDASMSQIFFDELGIPKPDIYLGVGSASHAVQTARIMVAFEEVLFDEQPDLVVVVGDVNSTLACALTAAKLDIPVAHVEAGLRSFDRQMPEEINRLITDTISDVLFTTSREAVRNLEREGVEPARVHFVGNVMIDTLQKHRPIAERLGTPASFGLKYGDYALLTLHRPSNVDNPDILTDILKALATIQKRLPIVFPAHPRTIKQIERFGLQDQIDEMANVLVTSPQGYLPFLDLMMHARMVLTDSGGIQEETTALGIPCLTLRENTERPETLTAGTNQLVGSSTHHITRAAMRIMEGTAPNGIIPELWDGKAAERIVNILVNEPLP